MNNQQSTNPLKQYFRRPMLTCRLPSQYRYYDDGVVERTPTGELDVYPMTSIDEITVRTPDLLFNGEAVARVIKNCVPSVQDPWALTTVDINAILVSIKIASNGQRLEIGSNCPHCGNENTFDVDLPQLLDRLKLADYSKPLTVGKLEIYFKPLTYATTNDNNKRQFEIQKLANLINEMEEGEQKNINLTDIMQQFNNLATEILLTTIDRIVTPDTQVSERQYIHEFLQECDKQSSELIREHSVALAKQSDLPDLAAQCTNEECSKQYMQKMNLNVTDFFG